MSYSRTGLGEPCNSLALTAAKCVLRNALRPFLTRSKVTFLALVVVENPNEMSVFEKATEALLLQRQASKTASYRPYVNSLDDVTPIRQKNVLAEALKCRQSVILTSRPDEIPMDITFAADVVLKVQSPQARHFKIAAAHHGINNLNDKDAEFLASQSLADVCAAVRSPRPVHSGIRRLRRTVEFANVKSDSPAPTADRGKTLHQMEGLGSAKDWGLQLAEDVKEWKAGKIRWDDLDRGALISGPPGCGKTSFAKALANTCGLPIILGSASRWQAAGHLGDYLKAMRRTFKQAQDAAPSILFLDEFDSFGSRDALSADMDHADYRRQIINGLLECLDPSEGREGVIVIGATNFPDNIDPALLRPGRMDTLIQIPLPDYSARVAILKQYLGVTDEAEWPAFAVASEGMSGAEIEKVAREARRQQRRRSSDPISEEDVTALLPPVSVFHPEEMKRLAVHENGHAKIGTLLTQETLVEMCIRDRRPANAKNPSLGFARFESTLPLNPTADYFLGRIALSLGGIAAEQIVYGNHGGGCGGHKASDLATATDLAFVMLYNVGLGKNLTYMDADASADRQRLLLVDREMRARVEEVLQRQMAEVRTMLTQQISALRHLSDMLAADLYLDGEAVRALLAELPVREPAI